MRCKNCGWVNPDKNAKCEKCNVLLVGLQVDTELPEKPSAAGFDPKETAKGCRGCGYPVRLCDTSCPNCGRKFGDVQQEPPAIKEETPPIEQPPAPEPKPEVKEPTGKICPMCNESVPENARFCTNCGASFTNENKQAVEGTINPWMPPEQVQISVPECSLSPVSKKDKPAKDTSLRFSGNFIQLNRGNTDPGNQTITAKVQAELTFENDKWYLQDKSALKTTYIYAGEKKELKPGDVIVLGNRLFEFRVPANRPD